MLSKQRCVAISRPLIRHSWRARIHLQKLVSLKPRMHMNVKMWHLLEGSLANRMPNTKSLVWKRCCDCAGNSRERNHQRGSSSAVESPDIGDMLARHDQCVTRMKLPKIHKRKGEIVFVNDAGCEPAGNDLTKRTLKLATVHSPNENKMSDSARGD